MEVQPGHQGPPTVAHPGGVDPRQLVREGRQSVRSVGEKPFENSSRGWKPAELRVVLVDEAHFDVLLFFFCFFF